MYLSRPTFAAHPFEFGRGPLFTFEPEPEAFHLSLSDDVKLFATTFVAGFLFVSLLIG